MHITKKQLEKYNTPNAILVISSYPKKNEIHSNTVCAVAGVTKSTFQSLHNISPITPIIILTMKQQQEDIYEEEGTLVIRRLQRNSLISYWTALKTIYAFSSISQMCVAFEFASFGDTLMTSLLPFFLLWLSLTGKNITLILHQVIMNLHDLHGHLGIPIKNWRIPFFSSLLTLYLRLLILPVKHIVVFEDVLKKRLRSMESKIPISVISHGIQESVPTIHQLKARDMLGISSSEKVILYFGYLTWYKGVDFLVKSLRDIPRIQDTPIRLIVAGGTSFTQGNKKHYQSFVSLLQRMCQCVSHMQLTGFVDEKDIPLYFSAADLVILPYRTLMASSGVLSLTLAYQKPFLLSNNLLAWTTNPDFSQSIQESGLCKKDISFRLTKDSLVKKIQESIQPSQQIKLHTLSVSLGKKRLYQKLAPLYNDILSQKISPTPSFFPKISTIFGG